MTKETSIRNPHAYAARMHRSLIDKIFFLDKADVDVIVDFGCADGHLIEVVHQLFPDLILIGYDKSDTEWIDRRKNRTNVYFFNDLKNVHKKIDQLDQQWRQEKQKPLRTALLLSSVIHEVYSYGRGEVSSFWTSVFYMNCDYVIIRDMCVSHATSRPSDPISVAKVRQRFDRDKIRQWEAQWGSLSENWSLVHFFLTHLYTENWERELRENYLPLALDELLSLIPARYNPVFIEHYTLPYIRDIVEKTFGVQLQDRTHLKLILQNKG